MNKEYLKKKKKKVNKRNTFDYQQSYNMKSRSLKCNNVKYAVWGQQQYRYNNTINKSTVIKTSANICHFVDAQPRK